MEVESNVSKWGNCLAVRILADIARKWGARAGSPIEIIQREGEIILRKKTYSLAQALAQITEDNLHPEIDTGPPVGKEIWQAQGTFLTEAT